MTLYESIPQQVEAVQWTGRNLPELISHSLNGRIAVFVDSFRLLAGKDGAQGWVIVPVGHWIVHKPGDLSDVWPVDPDYFASKYRPARTTEGDT